MAKHRLRRRTLGIWQRDYLVNRRLWPNIERAIGEARATARFTESSLVLDVGCGQKPYQDHFGPARYLGMDRTREDSLPDILGDACQIPVKSEAVDVVFSTQVIEHVTKPDQLLKEFYRVLKPGGSLVLSGPMYWPLHEEPRDFFRFTKHGFAHLLGDSGFKRWNIEEDGGDWAQIMLAINLKLTSRLAIPLRCIVNIAGLILDNWSESKLSPANYTIWAQR
jgi:SAM-dependent methyltransferase